MSFLALTLLFLGNAIFAGLLIFYNKRSKEFIKKSQLESEKRERELKRKVLELQVLRSLGERVGYSLDIHEILEVITDSLKGLVEFSTVSYITYVSEGRMKLKIKVEEPVSRLFVDTVKMQILNAFGFMSGRGVNAHLLDELITGSQLDERSASSIGSYFNVPIVINGQIVAMINVSSTKKGLYGDEETLILYTIINQASSQASKLLQVLENEKRRLSSMISSLSDGIFMVDRSFKLIVANPSVYKILNLPDNSTVLDIEAALKIHFDLRASIKEAITRLSVVKIPVKEINGRAVEIEIQPVIDKYSYLLGAVVVLGDVSAQKQLERLRQDFTAMMVHELRTPLTTVIYGTEALYTDSKKMSQDELLHYYQIIKTAANDMIELVNDLLDVARIESGKFEIVKRPGSIKTLIDKKIETFKPLAQQKNIRLESSLAPNLPEFSFDPVRIGQALGNLISNAIKYTDEGYIKVSAWEEKNSIFVSVSDTGDGIKAEDLPKLFSKFRQVGRGKTGEKGGTGLGLVIVKGIIEAHGGSVWVKSEGVGKGSTFTFSLPKS